MEKEWERKSRRENRRDLEEGENELEENRKAAELEMKERQQLLQKATDTLAEMSAELEHKKQDTMAAARRDDEEAVVTTGQRRGGVDKTLVLPFHVGEREIPRDRLMTGVKQGKT